MRRPARGIAESTVSERVFIQKKNMVYQIYNLLDVFLYLIRYFFCA